MTKIEQEAKKLNAYLLNREEVKEFKKYEALIKEDKELQALENKIRQLQKQIVKQKANQDSNVNQTIATYQCLKEKFESHPIVVNYLYLKQEVDDLLQEVNYRINIELSNKKG